jgi:transcription elongation factor Elf1
MDIHLVNDARISCPCGARMPVVLRARLDTPIVEYVASCDACGLTVECDADMNTEEAFDYLERMAEIEAAF